MIHGRIEPLAPSRFHLRRIEWTVRLLVPPVRALWRAHEVSASGLERFPSRGPVLVVSNHVGFLDPMSLMMALGRPIQLMGTESLTQDRLLAWLSWWFGVVPRKKFAADPRSVRLLQRWRDVGAVVGLFPEGQRSWDGRGLPLVPGIERLVRILDIPVVTARIINAYRQWPRWALCQRRTRVHVEIGPPRRFGADTPPAEIRAHIEDGIRVDPLDKLEWPARGSNLALGVTNVLFACPACGGMEALAERRDDVSCRVCARRWTLDADHLLHDHRDGSTLPLHAAVARVREEFARTFVADRSRFEAEGVVLESEPMELLDISGHRPVPVARGILRLLSDAIEVGGDGGKPLWRVSLADLSVVTVDLRRRLQLRSGERLFEAILPRESVVKWDWIANEWRKRAAGGATSPP